MRKINYGWNIQSLPPITPHILRHTGCTRMAEAGIDPRTLQDIMGHASMKMTMELYNLRYRRTFNE
ncbi:tyrosine-type recombinase/integrase [Blautia sp.]